MTPEQRIQQLDGVAIETSSGNCCRIRIIAQHFEQAGVRVGMHVCWRFQATAEDRKQMERALEVLLRNEGFLNPEHTLLPHGGSRGERIARQFVAHGRAMDPHDN